MSDFWPRAISETGRDGRGTGYLHRPQHWRLYQFYRLLKGTERIHVLVKHIRIHLRCLVAAGARFNYRHLQFAIAHTSWIGLVRIISFFGASALAGYTVAIRILIFIILPSWGLSNAAATLVGQNLGAKQS